MKPFTGFKSEPKKSGKYPMLPAGAYVAQIVMARVIGKEPDQTLVLRLEISEGEHAGYFTDRYNHDAKNSQNYKPQYKGDLKLRIPNENNQRARYPESDLKTFNDAIYRIESSNPGYHWDWNEDGLAGLTVGLNMQAGEYNGYPYTRPGRLETADDVRNGIVEPMKARDAQSDATEPPVDQQSGYADVTGQIDLSEVPF